GGAREAPRLLPRARADAGRAREGRALERARGLLRDGFAVGEAEAAPHAGDAEGADARAAAEAGGAHAGDLAGGGDRGERDRRAHRGGGGEVDPRDAITSVTMARRLNPFDPL